MTTFAIVFPTTLPTPSVSSVTPAERRLLSDLTGGPQQARGLQRDYLATQRVEWALLTADEADAFNGWWRVTLTSGGAWFASTWPAPQGWVSIVRRFVGAPQWTHLPGGMWHVSASVQVRGRGMPPMLSWAILSTDIFPYKVVATSDTTDYSAPGLDDSGWLTGHGTFGDQPHTFADGWPPNPTTIVPTLTSIWIRKRSRLPLIAPITINFKADNDAYLWVNGAATPFTRTMWLGAATYTPTDLPIVLAFRVDDTGPPGTGNRFYAGIEAHI